MLLRKLLFLALVNAATAWINLSTGKNAYSLNVWNGNTPGEAVDGKPCWDVESMFHANNGWSWWVVDHG